MHRLMGMRNGGQSKDNSDLSGWLDNRQMGPISHRTGMHHMHLFVCLLCISWVCLIDIYYLLFVILAICVNCSLLVCELVWLLVTVHYG